MLVNRLSLNGHFTYNIRSSNIAIVINSFSNLNLATRDSVITHCLIVNNSASLNLMLIDLRIGCQITLFVGY